ncbi:hypothetical protein [Streptomyces sp. NPDC002692]
MNGEKEPVPTLAEICRDVAAGSNVLARRMLPVAGRGAHAFVAFLGGAPLGNPVKTTSAKAKTGEDAKGKPGLRTRLRAKPARPVQEADEKPAAETEAAPAKDAKSPEPDAAGPASGPASGEAPGKKADTGKARGEEPSAGGLVERLGIGVLTLAIGWAFLRPVLPAVGRALAQVALPFALIGMVLWVVAAYRAAPRNDQEKDAGGEQPTQTAGPGPADVAAAETWLRHLVIQRVQEAVADGRRGIHLSALLEEPGIPDTWTVTTVREHCERLAIPIKSIRIRGSKHKGPTHGVHTDELTTALGMSLAQALQHLDEATAHTAPDDPGRASFGDVLDASSAPALTGTDETLPDASPAPGEVARPGPLPGGAPHPAPAPPSPPPLGAHPHPSRTPLQYPRTPLSRSSLVTTPGRRENPR